MHKRTNHFTILKILHTSMITGPVLFAIIGFWLSKQGVVTIVDESVSRILQVSAVIFSLLLLYAGFNLFKKRILSIHGSPKTAVERMALYKTACITWWAMIEIPAVFALVCYLLTSNLSFFFLALFHILILFLFRPRNANIHLLLNLSSAEISDLEGK